MKKVKDLVCGSPSKHFLNLKEENRKKIEFAVDTIRETEEFLEEYKKYLKLLQKIQDVLESEKIE